MRLFVASSFESGFVGNLKAIADYARKNTDAGAVKWVEPGDFHITYAFLGELPASGVAAAIKGIEAGLEGVKAFSVSSGDFGVFPSSRHPSVLWVGIADGAAELRAAAGKLADGLAAAGLTFERSFEPHVTLGRVKKNLPDDFLALAADFAQTEKAVSCLSSVELMESVLTPGGPVYRQVYSKRL